MPGAGRRRDQHACKQSGHVRSPLPLPPLSSIGCHRISRPIPLPTSVAVSTCGTAAAEENARRSYFRANSKRTSRALITGTFACLLLVLAYAPLAAGSDDVLPATSMDSANTSIPLEAPSAVAGGNTCGQASEETGNCFSESEWECVSECIQDVASSFTLLVLLCMGAHTLAAMLTDLGFPSITTFLFFGVLCGPFVLDALLPEQVARLTFINQLALGYIGLTAGGKLHVEDVTQNLGATLWITAGSVLMPYVFTLALTLLVGPYFMPFLVHLDFNSRLAVALLFASLAVARSPSSMIAIIEELHAKGPFTTIALTVTVLVDVIVVLVFAVTQLLVDSLEPVRGAAATLPPHVVLIRFVGQTLISVVLGAALGKVFAIFMGIIETLTSKCRGAAVGSGWRSMVAATCIAGIRIFLHTFERLAFLLTGYAFFLEEDADIEAGRWTWQNPLIVCMTCGFVIVNYTRAGENFMHAMHDVAGPILLIFFVYTGLTMDILALQRNWLACVLLFLSRSSGIFLGSRVGGWLGGQPREFYEKYWMTFLTQAGVSLGLAMSVPSGYVWKPDFVACSVALMVANQVVGPPLLKAAIKLMNEDNTGYHPKLDPALNAALTQLGTLNSIRQRLPEPRGGLIVGDPGDPVVKHVVQRLRRLKWEVVVADETLGVREEAERPPLAKAASVITAKQSVFQLSALPAPIREQVVEATATSWTFTETGRRSSVVGVEFSEPLPKSAVAGSRSPPALPTRPRSAVEFMHKSKSMGTFGSLLKLPGGQAAGKLAHRVRDKLPIDVVESVEDVVRFAGAPDIPELPEASSNRPAEDEEAHTKSLRLVWLMETMKNFDVVVVLLPDDVACVEICRLVSEVLPLHKAVRKLQEFEMPQVIVALQDSTALNATYLELKPLIIEKQSALQSLVTEILHPTAHWTGSLEDEGKGSTTEGFDLQGGEEPSASLLRSEASRHRDGRRSDGRRSDGRRKISKTGLKPLPKLSEAASSR